MKITVDRRPLHKAMQAALSVACYHSNIPALSHIKATANGTLSLEATDLDVGLRAEVPYAGDHAVFLIPDPRKVFATINAAGGSFASFETSDDNTLLVGSADFTGTLSTLPVDDFPSYEGVAEEDFAAELTSADFAQIARVFPAISTEETRYYLNGVAIAKVGEWTWRFYATDGHRLMMVDVPLPGATGDLPDMIITPKQWLMLATRHFAKSPRPLRLSYGPKIRRNDIDFTLPLGGLVYRMAMQGWAGEANVTLTTKLIDGNYPDITRVIPGDVAAMAELDRAQLLRAVSTISAMGDGRVRAVRLTFSKDQVTLSLYNAVLGEGRVSIPCKHNLHEGAYVGFNGRYLIDCANSLKGASIVFSWDEDGEAFSTRPCAIVDPEDTAFKAVLMPMRL